jgi:hypothetical protein
VGKYKGKIYLLIFAVTAGILAWGAWSNYRPQVIYASCADIAEKTTNIQKRINIVEVGQDEYEENLSNCLQDAGYY